MNGQRLQAQLSSMPGAWSSVLPGARARIWWKTPSSVAMISVVAFDSTARLMMPVVEAMKSACASTASSHSGCASTSASGWSIRSCSSRLALNCSCTMQVPGQMIRSGRPACCADPARQVLVGREDQRPALEVVGHLDRVGRGADEIAHRLHLGAAVDVGEHRRAGVGGDEGGELVRRAAVGERAAGLQIGHHDLARGVQDLGRLGHEVDAAEGDHVGFHLLGGLRELERVADEVGEVLDLGLLVVVGQDHGVALALDARDRGLEIVGEVRGRRVGGLRP